MLEAHIWHGEPVSESALRTLIYRFNLKTDYALIETIPLEGCRLLSTHTQKKPLEKGADT